MNEKLLFKSIIILSKDIIILTTICIADNHFYVCIAELLLFINLCDQINLVYTS